MASSSDTTPISPSSTVFEWLYRGLVLSAGLTSVNFSIRRCCAELRLDPEAFYSTQKPCVSTSVLWSRKKATFCQKPEVPSFGSGLQNASRSDQNSGNHGISMPIIVILEHLYKGSWFTAINSKEVYIHITVHLQGWKHHAMPIQSGPLGHLHGIEGLSKVGAATVFLWCWENGESMWQSVTCRQVHWSCPIPYWYFPVFISLPLLQVLLLLAFGSITTNAFRERVAFV